VIFFFLSAYDAQKIKQMSVAGETGTGLAVAGALALYIDFIGIFIYLLRIFGSRD
jgi:FtsH-binding integral membrane protein